MIRVRFVQVQIVLDPFEVISHVFVRPGRVVEHAGQIVEVTLGIGDVVHHSVMDLARSGQGRYRSDNGRGRNYVPSILQRREHGDTYRAVDDLLE
jgi:hypothetical protein